MPFGCSNQGSSSLCLLYDGLLYGCFWHTDNGTGLFELTAPKVPPLTSSPETKRIDIQLHCLLSNCLYRYLRHVSMLLSNVGHPISILSYVANYYL
jgi:hypothetical protein